MARKQIPVYLFVGMLESGKTKFIQETMEDPQFDSGDKTLLLVCEEGEEEYDPDRFAFGGVTVATIEDKAQLTEARLLELEKKSNCGRVIVEYNGMWLLQDLADALPAHWVIYQCLATADGTTIKTYAGDNAMRALLLDKLRASELLVVNRAERPAAAATLPTNSATARSPMTISPIRCPSMWRRPSLTSRRSFSASFIWTAWTTPKNTTARRFAFLRRSARPRARARTALCPAASR